MAMGVILRFGNGGGKSRGFMEPRPCNLRCGQWPSVDWWTNWHPYLPASYYMPSMSHIS